MAETPRERAQTDAGQCKDCKWSGWHMARTHYNTREWMAECRRYPPPSTAHSTWPTVITDDGCGEWAEAAPVPSAGVTDG